MKTKTIYRFVQILSACSIFTLSAAAQAKKIPPTHAQALAMVRSARMSCAPNRPCTPSVGMVSFVDLGTTGYQCTGTLVAPDVVLTNAHCVPVDLRMAGASCRGRVFMNFARDSKNPTFETQMDCSEVIRVGDGADDKSRKKLDYVLYHLERKSKRPFLQISRSGFEDDSRFDIVSVDPTGKAGKIDGVQRVSSCFSHMNTYYTQTYTSPLSQTVQFSDCRIEHGNSGSALVGADGMIHGVISASSTVAEYLPSEKKFLVSFKEGAKLTEVSVGTSVACIDIPEDLGVERPSPLCTEPAPKNTTLVQQNASIQEQMDAILQTRIKDYEKAGLFNWDYHRKGENIDFYPSCVLNPDSSFASADLGVLKFQRHLQLDSVFKFESVEVKEATNVETHASLVPDGTGFILKLGGETKKLPLCKPE